VLHNPLVVYLDEPSTVSRGGVLMCIAWPLQFLKRRLSVAISFTGDPLVVYLDEPSTVSTEGVVHRMYNVCVHGSRAVCMGFAVVVVVVLTACVRLQIQLLQQITTTESRSCAQQSAGVLPDEPSTVSTEGVVHCLSNACVHGSRAVCGVLLLWRWWC
jgi:hypothetical protein